MVALPAVRWRYLAHSFRAVRIPDRSLDFSRIRRITVAQNKARHTPIPSTDCGESEIRTRGPVKADSLVNC